MSDLVCGDIYVEFKPPVILAEKVDNTECLSGICQYAALLQVVGPRGICDPYRDILIECTKEHLYIYIFDDNKFRYHLYRKYKNNIPVLIDINSVLSSYISKLSDFFADIKE